MRQGCAGGDYLGSNPIPGSFSAPVRVLGAPEGRDSSSKGLYMEYQIPRLLTLVEIAEAQVVCLNRLNEEYHYWYCDSEAEVAGACLGSLTWRLK